MHQAHSINDVSVSSTLHSGRTVLSGLLLFLSLSVHCQNLNTVAAQLKINLIDLTWRVNADSTTVYEAALEREALSDQGAQTISKFAQSYQKTLQNFEVIEAYTLKADGRKIAVEKEGLQIQSGIANGGTSVSWPDAEITQITFPNVQKGDRTGWRMRITTHRPLLPGWASLTEYLPPSVQIDRFKATVQAPQSLGLQVVAVGMRMTTSQRAQNQVWQIEGENKASAVEGNAANLTVTSPHLIASTYKDAAQLGNAFAQQLNNKLVLTEEVRKAAAEMTKDAVTPQQKLVAIHDWVRKNIRYVAVYLGVGGWVPHDVDWILKNGYGDCKDHVLLMQALLKAMNIEAVPVLINTSNNYELPELPTGFNHCIIYLPAMDLFADPTDGRIPLGALPWVDADKPVVVALASGSKTMRTPAFSPASNHLIVKTHLEIASNGKATGEVVTEAFGAAATTLQNRLVQIPTDMQGIAVEKILSDSHWRGRGVAQYPAVQRDVQTQTLKIADLEIDNLLNDPMAGSVSPNPALSLPIYILNNTGNYTAATRAHAFPCAPITVREEFEMKFDSAFQLLRIPSDFQAFGPDGIAFEAHYRREGNTVTGWREMTLSHQHHVCSASDYEARRPVMGRIIQHLRSGVLFQQ